VSLADDLKERVRDRVMAAATLAGVELRTQLREETNKRTGRTSRGWYFSPPVLAGDAVEFHMLHPQGPDNPPDPVWLSSGTRAHWIPRGGKRGPKILRFEGNDGVTFRPVVWHPGYTGSGFIERILAPENVSDVVQRALAATP
jgi:hypothetical protein